VNVPSASVVVLPYFFIDKDTKGIGFETVLELFTTVHIKVPLI
jgi:hypothetical protein